MMNFVWANQECFSLFGQDVIGILHSKGSLRLGQRQLKPGGRKLFHCLTAIYGPGHASRDTRLPHRNYVKAGNLKRLQHFLLMPDGLLVDQLV